MSENIGLQILQKKCRKFGIYKNWGDKKHGELSCNKIIELKLFDQIKLTEEDKDLILRLITAHCIEDMHDVMEDEENE